MNDLPDSHRKKVVFQFKGDPDSAVFVAGTFNGWNPKKHRLTFSDGVYTAALPLLPGRYEYKFVVDGAWCVDPDCPNWVPNEFGSLNSVITVA